MCERCCTHPLCCSAYHLNFIVVCTSFRCANPRNVHHKCDKCDRCCTDVGCMTHAQTTCPTDDNCQMCKWNCCITHFNSNVPQELPWTSITSVQPPLPLHPPPPLQPPPPPTPLLQQFMHPVTLMETTWCQLVRHSESLLSLIHI